MRVSKSERKKEEKNSRHLGLFTTSVERGKLKAHSQDKTNGGTTASLGPSLPSGEYTATGQWPEACA